MLRRATPLHHDKRGNLKSIVASMVVCRSRSLVTAARKVLATGLLLLSATVLIGSCGGGYSPEVHTSLEMGPGFSTGGPIYFVLRYHLFQKPQGLARFPDGGQSRTLVDRLYLMERHLETLTVVGVVVAPDGKKDLGRFYRVQNSRGSYGGTGDAGSAEPHPVIRVPGAWPDVEALAVAPAGDGVSVSEASDTTDYPETGTDSISDVAALVRSTSLPAIGLPSPLDFVEKSRKELKEDLVALRGDQAYRNEIIRRLRLTTEERQKLIDAMTRRRERLEGSDRLEYQIYSEETIDALRSPPFTVGAVQFSVDAARYAGTEDFFAAVEGVISRVLGSHDVDLLVFPEYLNALLLAASCVPPVEDAGSFEEVAAAAVAATKEAPSLGDLLVAKAPGLLEESLGRWSKLAAEYEIALVPGTFFVPVDGELRNRLYLIDADGTKHYYQDKVFLTPEEDTLLDLSPGRVADASTVNLGDVSLAITVCRDSYFSEWDEILGDADLWIDLRANGEPYTPEVRRRFGGTLPERVDSTEANGGVSATLTGGFLDLVWEGPAYAVDADGRRIAESPAPTGDSVLLLSYFPKDESLSVVID